MNRDFLSTTGLQRTDRPEWLDEPNHPNDEVGESLRDVWLVNRYLGGTSVLLRYLAALMRRLGPRRTISVLDIATGSGHIPLFLVGWARQRGWRLKILATDIHPAALAAARARCAGEPDIRVEPANALALPYGDGEFDTALCTLALHHFSPQGGARLLREMARVSRHGFIVNDLLRCRPAYVSARLLARLVWRNPITRHDGPLSVLRAYTRREAEDIVRQSGVPARVSVHFPYRLAIAGGPELL